MHRKGGDLNRDRQVARPGGWLDRVAKTLITSSSAPSSIDTVRLLNELCTRKVKLLIFELNYKS